MAAPASATMTPGNRLYLYQLLTEQLGVSKQVPLEQAEGVLAADDVLPQDVGFRTAREMLESPHFAGLARVDAFKKGRILVTMLPNAELDEAVAAARHAEEAEAAEKTGTADSDVAAGCAAGTKGAKSSKSGSAGKTGKAGTAGKAGKGNAKQGGGAKGGKAAMPKAPVKPAKPGKQRRRQELKEAKAAAEEAARIEAAERAEREAREAAERAEAERLERERLEREAAERAAREAREAEERARREEEEREAARRAAEEARRRAREEQIARVTTPVAELKTPGLRITYDPYEGVDAPTEPVPARKPRRRPGDRGAAASPAHGAPAGVQPAEKPVKASPAASAKTRASQPDDAAEAAGPTLRDVVDALVHAENTPAPATVDHETLRPDAAPAPGDAPIVSVPDIAGDAPATPATPVVSEPPATNPEAWSSPQDDPASPVQASAVPKSTATGTPTGPSPAMPMPAVAPAPTATAAPATPFSNTPTAAAPHARVGGEERQVPSEAVLATYPAGISGEVFCPTALLSTLTRILPLDVELMALLDEDWRVALATGNVAGSRNRATFPLRYLREDGSRPVEVALRRGARSGSAPARWELALVDGDDGCGDVHASASLEGLPLADEGSWEDLRSGAVGGNGVASPIRAFAQFATIGTWDAMLGELARTAAPERWGYPGASILPSAAGATRYGILREYLTVTFCRVRAQGKLVESADGRFAAFNTGLVTPALEPIHACFEPGKAGVPRRFAGFALAGSGDLGRRITSELARIPEAATYVERLEHVAPLPGDPLALDFRALLDDCLGRLPRGLLLDALADMEGPSALVDRMGDAGATPAERIAARTQLARFLDGTPMARRRLTRALEDAAEGALAACARSYRVAVPVYDPASDAMKLLLPLSLVGDGRTDAALVAQRGASGTWQGTGLLTLPRAYACARVVSAEQPRWLAPEVVLG